MPSLIVFLFFSFLTLYQSLYQNIYLIIFLGLVYFVFLYASFIHMSIINVLKFEKVPLVRFSYTINYIIITVLAYFSFLYSFLQKDIFLILLYIIIFAFIIIFENLISLEYEVKDRVLYVCIGIVIFLILGIFFLFYPISIFIAALSLSLVMYIYNGILLHNRISRMGVFNYFEYFIFSLIIIISLIYIPSWGIAGHL